MFLDLVNNFYLAITLDKYFKRFGLISYELTRGKLG